MRPAGQSTLPKQHKCRFRRGDKRSASTVTRRACHQGYPACIVRSSPFHLTPTRLRATLNKPFDRLRANGMLLIPFVVSLSNHDRNRLAQRCLSEPTLRGDGADSTAATRHLRRAATQASAVAGPDSAVRTRDASDWRRSSSPGVPLPSNATEIATVAMPRPIDADASSQQRTSRQP